MNLKVKEAMMQLNMRFAVEAYEALDHDQKLLASITLDDALESILSSEINGRDRRRQAMLLKTAKISLSATLNDLSYDAERGNDFSKFMSMAVTMQWMENGENICIYGAAGTGKSWVASALARETAVRGRSVMYWNAADLAATLVERKHDSNSSYQRFRKAIKSRKLLIIDDFCLKAPNEEEQAVLFDLLNDRTGRFSTLVTSQKDRNMWIENMGATPLAESIAERLTANAWELTLRGNSRRHTLK